MNQDEQNLNLLSIFHYVVGGLTALFSSMFLMHVAMGILNLLLRNTQLRSWISMQDERDAIALECCAKRQRSTAFNPGMPAERHPMGAVGADRAP